MSVSLVILRLEIASDCELPSLHFVAPKLERIMHSAEQQKIKESVPSVDTPTENPEDNSANAIDQPLSSDQQAEKKEKDPDSWKKKYRGWRELHEITIETFDDVALMNASKDTLPTLENDTNFDKNDNVAKIIEKEEKISCEVKQKQSDINSIEEVKNVNMPMPPIRKKRAGGKNTAEQLDFNDKKQQVFHVSKDSSENQPCTKDGSSKELQQKELCRNEELSDSSSSLNKLKRSVSLKESSPPCCDLHLEMQKETSPALSDNSANISEHRSRGLFPTQIPFYSGNHFVEVTKGILHLYKENQRTPLAEEAERSEMLCILAVPGAMTTHDLLQFTAPVNENIEHMRIIRESKPNQYMVLFKFKNQQTADEFYKNFNGIQFNSIEPEICHLVYVAKVESVKESEEVCLPVPGHTELPTCPVCLERMDESVEGILTILCNHSFHSSCLAKWGDTSCPVCRYCQTPELEPDNRCFGCGSQENLWICLICGHIGCGRYVEGHAYKHYLETQHTYAMQLGNNRVWDYAGDNYVHRLVQNKTDGKLVELEPRWAEQEEKLDSIKLEYTYLLTSQLETQRHFFESRMSRMEEESHRQLEELKDKTKLAIEERKQLEEKLSRVSKEKQSQEKKISQLCQKLNKAVLELKEEKEMNKCLRQNQQSWQQRLKETEKQIKDIQESKEKEIQELQHQVRDLMFYLEARDTLQNMPESTRQEIQDGQIVVGASAGPVTPRHRSKKKR
ncbi:BRCA1-associated protein-like [Centruroides sculpturatus]|uniref:BRCA1-associated protein-like n=1 Tax=Centruroides sculpturatus TaxID=218467 RepID=UPI000C6D67F9|nr:BRCA1-associated protein-like [Centruroides sculpturatus]